MSFNYGNYLMEKLEEIKQDLSLNINVNVVSEQAFIKMKDFKPNNVYVIIKMLTASLSYEGKTQPVQLLCLSEENSLKESQELLNAFTERLNWSCFYDDDTFIKQTYTNPVVLSNFEEIAIGFRSVLYVTGTLFILEDVVDVKELTIDNNVVNASTFTFNYSMTPNTQQIASEKFATSVKSVSAIVCSLVVPLIDCDLTDKIIGIISNDANYTGNENFIIKWKMNSSSFNFSFNMKLTSAQIVTAPNQVPSLTLSFAR